MVFDPDYCETCANKWRGTLPPNNKKPPTLEQQKAEKDTKSYKEPIWVPYNPQQPTTQTPPPQQNTPLSQSVSLSNIFGSTQGEIPLILNDDNTVKQSLDLKDGHLHEAYTQTAFLMNNNPDSNMTLSADTQRFDESFDKLNANKSAGSENTISKDEFLAFLQDYSREAVESGSEGEDYRNKPAVHFDETNMEELGLAFEAMAGEDKLIDKQEFVEFWDELLKTGEEYVDPNSGKTMTKVTGAQLNDAINKRLEEKGLLPTFRKSEEEVQNLLLEKERTQKETELKNLNVNIDSNLVTKIEYSKDNSISFITLNDGTQLQIQNDYNLSKNGIQVFKENDRLVVMNDSSDELDNTNHRMKIIPATDSKITLRNCSGVTFSSQGDINDDVVVEGTAKNINLNVGGGIDKYVNNTNIADTNKEIRIIKSASNDSVQLRGKQDIAVARENSENNNTYYYSINDHRTRQAQQDDLAITQKTLERSSDIDLLKIVLFDSVEDAGQISTEDLLAMAKEKGFDVNQEPALLTKNERTRLSNELSALNINSDNLSDTDLVKQYLFNNSNLIKKLGIDNDAELLEYAKANLKNGNSISELTTEVLINLAKSKSDISFTDDVKSSKTLYMSDKDRQRITNEYISSKKDAIQEMNKNAKLAESNAMSTSQSVNEISEQIKSDKKELKLIETQYDREIAKANPNEEILSDLQAKMDAYLTRIYNNEEELKKTYNEG